MSNEKNIEQIDTSSIRKKPSVHPNSNFFAGENKKKAEESSFEASFKDLEIHRLKQ